MAMLSKQATTVSQGRKSGDCISIRITSPGLAAAAATAIASAIDSFDTGVTLSGLHDATRTLATPGAIPTNPAGSSPHTMPSTDVPWEAEKPSSTPTIGGGML